MFKRLFRILFLFILQTFGLICRRFSQTVAFIRFILVPFQSDAYLRVYLNILQHVQEPSAFPVGGISTLWRRRLHLTQLGLHLKSLHFLWLFLFPSASPLDVFLHFDIFDYLIPRFSLNGVAIAATHLVIFYNERLFFHVDTQIMDRLVAVIHHQSTEWFPSPTYKSKGRQIGPLLCRLYRIIFNLQSTYHLTGELLIVYFEVAFLRKVWPTLTALRLLVHGLSLLSFLLFANAFFFIFPLAFTTLLTALAMFTIKMSQIYSRLLLLLKQPRSNLFHRKLAQLERTFLRTCIFFLRLNTMYRWIFATLLLIAVPLNLILTIGLLSRRISLENLPFAAFLLYYTFLFIFIFHLAFAYPSKAIHRFAPLFQHTLVCKHPASGRTRSRIRLSHLIAAFLVPSGDRYGFNYGNWGLVSLEAFLQYLLIYTQLSMTLYKLLN